METVEIQAKTLEEAKQTAAEQLGVKSTQLEVTVLEEAKGLFGRGFIRILAKVKASKASKSTEKVEAKPTAKSSPKPAAASPAKKKAEPKRTATAAVVEKEPEGTSDSETDERIEAVATDQDAVRIRAILDEILDSAGLDVSIKSTGLNGRYVNFEIDGRDAAFLVGRQGEVLNAFQYVMNLIATRQLANGVRVTLDGNQYRQRREVALSRMATQIAEQVKERGEEAVLDALPAFERRIVHQALAEYEGVSTYSEGEEPNRRVVIAPA